MRSNLKDIEEFLELNESFLEELKNLNAAIKKYADRENIEIREKIMRKQKKINFATTKKMKILKHENNELKRINITNESQLEILNNSNNSLSKQIEENEERRKKVKEEGQEVYNGMVKLLSKKSTKVDDSVDEEETSIIQEQQY